MCTFSVCVKKDDKYLRFYFDDPEEAKACAKQYDEVVMCELRSDIRRRDMRRLIGTGIVLGTLFVLSVIGWGWLYSLSGVGII